MCQAAPGPRCYNDTSKVLRTRKARIESLEKKKAEITKSLDASASVNDFTAYAVHRKAIDALNEKLAEEEKELRYDNRDAYGTRTGSKILEKKMKAARTESEAEQIRLKLVQGSALRFAREHALEMKRSGTVPAIKFARAA